jgi:hypothetical protein
MLSFERSVEVLRSEALKKKYPILSELNLHVASARRTPSLIFHIRTGRIIAVFYYDKGRREFYNSCEDDTVSDIGSMIDSVRKRYIVANAWWI